jgi:hypothetical protein
MLLPCVSQLKASFWLSSFARSGLVSEQLYSLSRLWLL